MAPKYTSPDPTTYAKASAAKEIYVPKNLKQGSKKGSKSDDDVNSKNLTEPPHSVNEHKEK